MQELLWSEVNTASERIWLSAPPVFEAVGNFDVALDVGTPSRGAGDIEMFHRILANGYSTFYDAERLCLAPTPTQRRGFEPTVAETTDSSFGAYLLTCYRNRYCRRL